jgi:hypothetical protein
VRLYTSIYSYRLHVLQPGDLSAWSVNIKGHNNRVKISYLSRIASCQRCHLASS